MRGLLARSGMVRPPTPKTPLVPVSLFFFFAVVFSRCHDASAQSFTIPAGATVSWKDKKDAVQKVTEEPGYWVPDKVARGCIVNETLVVTVKDKWLECEKRKGKPESKLSAYVTGGALGAAIAAILMAVLL